jgi:hypothetical protein
MQMPQFIPQGAISEAFLNTATYTPLFLRKTFKNLDETLLADLVRPDSNIKPYIDILCELAQAIK